MRGLPGPAKRQTRATASHRNRPPSPRLMSIGVDWQGQDLWLRRSARAWVSGGGSSDTPKGRSFEPEGRLNIRPPQRWQSSNRHATHSGVAGPVREKALRMTDIQKSMALRRSIASSAFTMFMLVAMVGLFSLFSIWSINRAWIDGTRQTVQLDSLSRAALDAQVSFKVQVQEWKNILLRGEDPVLLEKYLESFKANATETQKNISRVTREASSLGFIGQAVEAEGLARTHQTLTLRYETALAEAQAGSLSLSPTSARQVDLSLRGIDRDLETSIGILADEIVDLASQERRTLETRMQDRYLTLRWFIISVIILSLVITAYVLTGAMRATRT